MKNLPLGLILVLISVSQSFGQASAPTSQPMRIVINGVEGTVQARKSPEAAWEKATPGMELVEGAQLRTGVRSAVRFVILPDQTITLDRLGTLEILRANFEGEKIVTDLGMKYGRTRYDIDAEGRQHDAKVHSPSSVLAIRGTKVSLYDQPPFAPRAVSLTGRARYQDKKKTIEFGSKAKTAISDKKNSSAETEMSEGTSDGRGSFTGRSDTDRQLQMSLAAYGGKDFSDLGVLAYLDSSRAGKFNGTVIGALPIGRQLVFNLFWTGSPFSDVDLSVTSPLGETVSLANPKVRSSGEHLGNGVADVSGVGQEQVVWQISYPVGTYNVEARLKKGTSADALIIPVDDPLKQGIQLDVIQGKLTRAAPVVTGKVKAPK